MWGMIAKIKTAPGKRGEMIAILQESAADMPGCLELYRRNRSGGRRHFVGDRGLG